MLLNEDYWRRKFGADPATVGQALTLNGIKRTVIGAVPGALQVPTPNTELWVPLALTEEQVSQRFNFYLTVLARLGPGISDEQARSAMKIFTANLWRAFPGSQKMGSAVRPLRYVLTASIKSTLNLLLAIVGIVLLIACINVAQLLLARGAGRAREMALCSALGAERGRVLRQLLTESLLLAMLGALAGTGIAAATLWFLTRLIPQSFPQGTALAINLPVLAYTAALAFITAVVFGVVPALISVHADAASVLKLGGRRMTAGGGRVGLPRQIGGCDSPDDRVTSTGSQGGELKCLQTPSRPDARALCSSTPSRSLRFRARIFFAPRFDRLRASRAAIA